MRINRVKLIAEMARQDMTVKALAEKAALSRLTISAMRSGKSVNENTATNVARALGMNLEDLKED